MNRTRTIRTTATVFAVAWMGVIFGLSSLHGSSVPGRYSTLGHFILYAVLGTLYFTALPAGGRWAIVAVALASLYGISDEIHQSFVPGRMPDPVDWLVDTAGALTAVMLAEGLRRLIARRDARSDPA
ncbi:MAG: VanZ family protein [Coriobacteriia bacterium]|nr:VanZ family protein [Coriobacteriia bacterium]